MAPTLLVARAYTGDNYQQTNLPEVYSAVLLGIVLTEWIGNLRAENRYIWQAPSWNLPKVLYLVSRYVTLALTIAVFALNFVDLPVQSCNALVRFNCLALTVIQVTSISVLTQEVWALTASTGRSYWIMALLLVMDLATFVIGIVHAATSVEASSSAMMNGSGMCQVVVKHTAIGLTAAFFIIPIIAHTLATCAVVKELLKLPGSNALRHLLLVDGIIYLVAVNTIGIVQVFFFLQTWNQDLRMLNSAALLALTSVFCCRFILHIRQRAKDVARQPFRPSGASGHEWSSSSTAGRPLSGSKVFRLPLGLATPGSTTTTSRKPTESASSGSMTVTGSQDDSVELDEKLAAPFASDAPEVLVSPPMTYITVQRDVHTAVDEQTESERGWTQHEHKHSGNTPARTAAADRLSTESL